MSLETLSERYWQHINQMAPTVATIRGVHDYDDQLPQFDDDWVSRLTSTFETILDECRAIPTEDLETQQLITRALLIHQCESVLGQLSTPFRLAPIDPFLGPHIRLLSDTRQNTVTESAQADQLLERYTKVPGFLEGAMRIHRANADQGMTPAGAVVSRVLGQLDGYLGSGIDDDPFLALNVPGDDGSWRERAEQLVTEAIRPAIESYRSELVDHIIPGARPDDRAGLMWIPGGEEIYADLIAQYVQLEISPQQIHEIGLEWATQINAAEWSGIGKTALGLEDLDDIFSRLHQDPSLRFGSEDEMLDHARNALDRAWAVVDNWFAARPATPCNVVPVPAAVAPAMPPAYYMQPPLDGSRPGTYFLNTYRPGERDRFEYESIHFHEGIPGHHFDRSLAAELDGIPTFRRYAQVYAHTEGWGLYSERLADEMGLYSTDVDRLGMVSADAWRAGRLVTDTGIHVLGWSRQQAIDFLTRWTPIGPLTVEQEIDRYVGMPGQALSYKMGQLEISRLRAEAEDRLGDGFDIKGFHDTMLIHGAMPLPMLAVAVEDWITRSERAQRRH